MSTDYYCSRSRGHCEHYRSWCELPSTHPDEDPRWEHTNGTSPFAEWPGDACDTCDWHYTAVGSHFYAEPPEKCPRCGADVTLYGEKFVSERRLELTRALTGQAWAVAIAVLDLDEGIITALEAINTVPTPAEMVDEIMGGR